MKKERIWSNFEHRLLRFAGNLFGKTLSAVLKNRKLHFLRCKLETLLAGRVSSKLPDSSSKWQGSWVIPACPILTLRGKIWDSGVLFHRQLLFW